MRAQDHELPPRRQHAAPVGRGRLGAEAEEGEPRRRQDLRADVEAEGHDDRREELRHDVAHQNQAVGAAERARGFHELALANREYDAAHEARVDRKAHDRDRDHRVSEPRAQPGHDGDREEDVGKRHQDVGQPHDDGLAPARVVAAEDAQDHADQHRRRRRRRAGHEGDARAPHQPREQVAPELVGAEPVPGRERRPEPIRRVHGVAADRGRRARLRPCPGSRKTRRPPGGFR